MRVFVHIGMEKTGSTFLQKRFFPNLDGVDFATSQEATDLISSLVWAEEPVDLAKIGVAGRKILSKATGDILISNETFTGRPNTMRHEATWVASIICSLFPMLEVILFIRRQDTFLESHFKMAVRKGSKLGYKRYLSLDSKPTQENFFHLMKDEKKKGTSTNSGFGYTDYRVFSLTDILKPFLYLRGENRLLVIPYEKFSADPESCFDELWSFLGKSGPNTDSKVKVNLGLSQNRFLAAQYVNRFAPTGRGIIDRIFSSIVHRGAFGLSSFFDFFNEKPASVLAESDKKFILNFHKEGNREISKKLNLGLDEWGYF